MTTRLLLVAATLAALCALGGCAASQPPLDTTTATQLQSDVRAIATSSSSGDYAQALSRLDALQSELDQAVKGNKVTAQRASHIQRIIDEVRADLTSLSSSATPSPTPTVGHTHPGKPGHGKGNGNGNGNG